MTSTSEVRTEERALSAVRDLPAPALVSRVLANLSPRDKLKRIIRVPSPFMTSAKTTQHCVFRLISVIRHLSIQLINRPFYLITASELFKFGEADSGCQWRIITRQNWGRGDTMANKCGGSSPQSYHPVKSQTKTITNNCNGMTSEFFNIERLIF